MDHPRFLVDRMLGRLVAWLRIFDYDTKSALELGIEENEDVRLVEIASDEKRILLTRDRGLVERAGKARVEALLITPDDVKAQICELLGYYSIETEPIMARCTVCNAKLRKATATDMDRIRGIVPAHLIDEGKDFWICDHCGKIYWRGSHWRNIEKMSSELKQCITPIWQP